MEADQAKSASNEIKEEEKRMLIGVGRRRGCLDFTDHYFFLHAMQQQQPNSCYYSIWLIPSDVLQQHILRWLSLPSLITCSLTGSRLNKIATKIIATARGHSLLHSRTCFSTAVLKLLFEDGKVQLAEWFQKYLHYPVFDSTPRKNPFFVKCLCLAAKGTVI